MSQKRKTKKTSSSSRRPMAKTLKRSKAKSRGIKPAQDSKVLHTHHRDVFFRPERNSYVRRQHKNPSAPPVCVFCEASAAEIGFEHLKVWQSELTMVLLNKFPYNQGHLLVLPRRHFGEMENATRDEMIDIGLVLQASIKVLRKAYDCPALNLGANLGSAAGAGIPGHLHLHVVPRWPGDTNFFPILAGSKVVIESLEQTFDRLLPLFMEVKQL